MKAIILAAGEGKRIAAATNGLPKCLLDIAGQPILGRQFYWLEKNGIKEITVVIGYLPDKIKQYCRDYTVKNNSAIKLSFVENKNYSITNNAYSLAIALEENLSPFILLNSDVVCDPRIIRQAIDSARPNCLCVKRKTLRIDEDMKVNFKENGEITRINKDLPSNAKYSYEFTGIAKISENIAELKKQLLKHPGWWYEYVFDDMLVSKMTGFFAEDIKDYPCTEIDFPSDLEEARIIFSKE